MIANASPRANAPVPGRRGHPARAVLPAAVAAALLLQVSAPAVAAATYVEAPVLSVDPVLETVRYTEPRERCRTERVPLDRGFRHDPPRQRRSATGPLVGGVIGGALGNAVGDDRDERRIGTVIGAILGASIASDIQRRARAERGRALPYRTVYENRQVCELVDVTRERQEVVAYDVAYEYAGRTAYTRMDRDPGATLRLRVDVTPVP